MTNEELAELVRLLRLHVPPAVEKWLPRSLDGKGRCLPSTRIGLEVLRYFGVKAVPLPTRAMAVNAAWQEWMHGPRPGPDLLPMPDEAWSVAVGWPSPGRGVDMHLVLHIEGRVLLDLDSIQFSRPGRAMRVEPTVLLPTLTRAHPDTGEPLVWAGMVLEGDGRLDYVEHPEPPAWKHAKDYRRADKPAGGVIRTIRAALGQ